MALPHRILPITRDQRWIITPYRWFSLVGLFLGLVIALLFGHAYDTKIFMATGYLVASGQSPYIAQDLTRVFHNNAFQGMTSFGYPPPWALVLGVIYWATYHWAPNLLLYNLAIKLPIITAALGLAYCVTAVLRELQVGEESVRKAWAAMLVSPFVVYFALAWGQFDAIVALLALLSMLMLNRGQIIGAAVSLALAIAFKPTPIPLLPVAFIFLWGKSSRTAWRFSAVTAFSLLIFCSLPFSVFGWDPAPILNGWNAHFTVAGGMSWMTFYELLKDRYLLPGSMWLLGLAWLPAIVVAGLVIFRKGISDFRDLLKASAGMILVFFLTRTWLSETNIMLLLPFIVILSACGDLPKWMLAALVCSALVFTIFNNSLPQLLFPAFPGAMQTWLGMDDAVRSMRLTARIGVVIIWQVLGWWMVVLCFSKRSNAG